MFGAPISGDIWAQTAQIKAKEKDFVILDVSDEHGGLFKQAKMPERFFQGTFFPHPSIPSIYIKRVKIENVEKDHISFVLIDLNGRPLNTGSQVSKIKKQIFLETYHLDNSL
ncbi:MAG: hypothetical protein WC460_04300 [Patescibacteria group bacterium]